MRQFTFTFLFSILGVFLLVQPSKATAITTNGVEPKAALDWVMKYAEQPEVKALSPELMRLGYEQFMNMTPSKYKELTGQKLGWKKTLELKAAQKMLKKAEKGGDISEGLYIVLAILGLGWVAMGIMDDWSGNDWIINLVLSLLCWLPGLIHALVKKKKYYS